MVDHLYAVNEPAACTDVFRRVDARQPLSKQLWQCDPWVRLPHTLSEDGTQAVAGDAARVQQFLAQHFTQFREANACSGSSWVERVKREYFAHACDLMELRHGDEIVGVMVGAPEDWTTYYIRMFALAPHFQKRVLARRFLRECVFEPLAELGVQRVTAETAPTNRAMVHLFSELEFYITGNQLTERWGPLVRYTKFLDPACETLFLERFGGTAP